MGAKFREINSFSFIGNLAVNQAERVWKEIDEDDDVINCKEKFDRKCVHIKTFEVVKTDLPDDSKGTRQIPVLVNDNVRVELMTTRSSLEGGTNHKVKGWEEVQIQVENKCTTSTSEGDFELKEGEVLVVPSEVSHRNSGEGGTTRLVIYTRRPLQVAKGYPVKDEEKEVKNRSERKCMYLKPKEVLELVEEGPSGGKHFELLENEDIMIETTLRADSQKVYHKGFGQDEVPFQLSGRRLSRTGQGDFMTETGDMLWIPPGVVHRNIGDMATMRIVMYMKDPLKIADEYNKRFKKIEEMKARKTF